ncbi:collagen-binding domain-containing protein [Paraglaciecola sp.]|uniref:collagen-binding domain-containing protein n=1 Tax=Paraglaciecola sp. TaxID=1920173 RepID=UPI0030F36F2E
MKYKFLIFSALSLGFLSTQVAAVVPNTNAHVGTYNLILKGDLDTSNDIEGRMLVGGNINMAGRSLDVGSKLPSSADIDAVTVVGNMTATDVKAENGNNIIYGGNIGSTTLLTNGGGTATQVNQSTLQSQFNSIWNSVEADSAYFASLATNASITGDSNNPRFGSSVATDLTVYSLSTNDLNNQNATYKFNSSPTVPVVINVDVTGKSNVVINAKSSIEQNEYGMVLWNFYNTDSTEFTLSFNGDGWRGSILAPYANITSSTNALEGGVAALSYTGSVQLHNYLYTYAPPPEPPTEDVPAPAGMLLIGLGLIVMARRKFTK